MKTMPERLRAAQGAIPDAADFVDQVMRGVAAAGPRRAKRPLRGTWVIGGLVAAAACLLAALLIYPDGRDSLAFAQVVENLRRTRSVAFTFVALSADGASEQWEVTIEDGVGMRSESGDMTVISDTRDQSWMSIVHSRREATIIRGTHQMARVYDWLRGLKGSATEPARREVVDGRDRLVFSTSDVVKGVPGQAAITLWVDPETELPVQAKLEITLEDRAAAAQVPSVIWLRDIRFGGDVEAGTFDTTVPEGYRLVGLDGAPADPTTAPVR